MPLGPGKAPAAASQVQARVPSSRVYRPQAPLPSSRRISVPQSPPVQVVPDVVISHEDEMEVEEHIVAVIDHYAADDADLTELSDREEDLHQEEDEGEQSEDERPMAKRQKIWPEVSTARAHRYRREFDDIKDRFHDEVDEFDTTMVSEYAEDIFDYMQELEVRSCNVVALALH